GVAAAADWHEHAANTGERSLHHRDVEGRRTEHRLDGGPEKVPTRTSPAHNEQVRPLARHHRDDGVPALPSDSHVRARGRARWHELVERATQAPRLRLRRREQLALGNLDDRHQEELFAPGEARRELDKGSLAL